METTIKESPAMRRLAQLETESQFIIDSYLKQVAIDANSIMIKNLQTRLKELRSEQWKLFDVLYPYAFGVNLSAAA